MLKVITGGYEAAAERAKSLRKKKEECYRNMYYDALYCEDGQDLKKIVFCGIKYAVYKDMDTKSSHRDLCAFLLELNEITHMAENLTFREICQIFPIGKDFDGWKYEAKDYWSAMKYLKGKDIDSVIGEDADDFFWHYYNPDIMNFGIKRTLIFDRLLRVDGKQGLMEGFLDVIDPKHEIHTYSINKEHGYIYDHETGKTAKLVKPRKRKPSYFSVV